MGYKKINNRLFIRNRAKLVKLLKPRSLAVIHSNDKFPRNGDQFFPFRQNSDMFYLTGLDRSKCILCLCPDFPDKKLREVVFTVRPDEKKEIWSGCFSKEDVTATSGIKTVKWLDNFETILRELLLFSDNLFLNDNEYPRFATEIAGRDRRFALKLKEEYPLHHFERLAPLLTQLRMIKEPEEIRLLKRASDITGKAFDRVVRAVRPGMKEYEAAAEIMYVFLKNGASGHAYAPIVASGENTCILHYTGNDTTCKDGDLLLLDFGAEFMNYAADCSRTIPVNGRFTKRQRECYDAVLRVFRQAINMLVPGITVSRLNNKVDKLMENEMIKLGLFTTEDVKNQDPEKPMCRKYYMHGTSHFIGLDVHDPGTKYEKLRKGMVVTCEPGIYIKDEGIGIRIENSILVDKKPVDLMHKIPMDADEIERLMKKNR
ncbi:MAG: aminopeptidase P N-terminal domain-containing protein [Bacteroidetes bacterium]|nr:aminopeptidase P N-terminal domain-containing protein [Bacteroidota bacterium]